MSVQDSCKDILKDMDNKESESSKKKKNKGKNGNKNNGNKNNNNSNNNSNKNNNNGNKDKNNNNINYEVDDMEDDLSEDENEIKNENGSGDDNGSPGSKPGGKQQRHNGKNGKGKPGSKKGKKGKGRKGKKRKNKKKGKKEIKDRLTGEEDSSDSEFQLTPIPKRRDTSKFGRKFRQTRLNFSLLSHAQNNLDRQGEEDELDDDFSDDSDVIRQLTSSRRASPLGKPSLLRANPTGRLNGNLNLSLIHI